MVGEAVGVSKNAAANHKAVYFGVFFVQFYGMGVIFDVAIDNKFGFGADFIAKFDDFGN